MVRPNNIVLFAALATMAGGGSASRVRAVRTVGSENHDGPVYSSKGTVADIILAHHAVKIGAGLGDHAGDNGDGSSAAMMTLTVRRGWGRALGVDNNGALTCDTDKDCLSASDNSECKKGTCMCKKDYYFDGEQCVSSKACDEFCRTKADPNSFCAYPLDEYPCMCKHMYYSSDGKCKKYKNLKECDADCQDQLGTKDVICDPKDTNICQCKKESDKLEEVGDNKFKCVKD